MCAPWFHLFLKFKILKYIPSNQCLSFIRVIKRIKKKEKKNIRSHEKRAISIFNLLTKVSFTKKNAKKNCQDNCHRQDPEHVNHKDDTISCTTIKNERNGNFNFHSFCCACAFWWHVCTTKSGHFMFICLCVYSYKCYHDHHHHHWTHCFFICLSSSMRKSV